MSARAVTLTGRERVFAPDEIIVSKTDVRGVITYANDVFIRVSGYSERELIGAPHSLLRHPDMPRCVFQLMWETIQAGREFFGYVNNRAKNGDNYWVHAHVTPTFGAGGEIIGYHSSRRAPVRSAVDALRPIYRALLAEEAKQLDRASGLRASRALCAELLAERGMTYDELVWSLTNAGMAEENAK